MWKWRRLRRRLWIPDDSWCRSSESSQMAAIAATLVLFPIRSPAENQILSYTLWNVLSDSEWPWVFRKTTYHCGCLPPVGKQTIREKIGGRKVSLGKIYLTWPLKVWKSSGTPLATSLIFSFYCGRCLLRVLLGEKVLLCCFRFEDSNLLFDNPVENHKFTLDLRYEYNG